MNLIYESETYKIIGICMEIHKHLGAGFLEVVYKDALVHEFRENHIDCEVEKRYRVKYKDIILDHHFYADMVVFGKIILEVKSVRCLHEIHIAQTINYLKVSGLKVGILVNFGEVGLTYKRIVL